VALQRLEEISRGPVRGLYDLARVEAPLLAALGVRGLNPPAAAVLGNLGTAESQRALVELASRNAVPLADRLAAASALARSTEKYGVLLTIPQIRLQYDRYSQSANQDQATQKILGLIIDATLAKLGTAESQHVLVEMASRIAVPVAERLAAAAAFTRSAEKNGIHLTVPQIRLQDDRYNQSANQDQATQKILGLILDAIEAPTHAARPPAPGAPQQGSTAASVMR
jgi:hypothetical protein